jgi:hypothetical protein
MLIKNVSRGQLVYVKGRGVCVVADHKECDSIFDGRRNLISLNPGGGADRFRAGDYSGERGFIPFAGTDFVGYYRWYSPTEEVERYATPTEVVTVSLLLIEKGIDPAELGIPETEAVKYAARWWKKIEKEHKNV